MKTYKGTFQLPTNGGTGRFTYIDTIMSPFKWIAVIALKMRNAAKLIKIEKEK
jgi:hypothetical protein